MRAEGSRHIGDLAQRRAGAPKLLGHEYGQQALLAHRVERLDGKPRVTVDFVRVDAGFFLGDALGPRDELLTCNSDEAHGRASRPRGLATAHVFIVMATAKRPIRPRLTMSQIVRP